MTPLRFTVLGTPMSWERARSSGSRHYESAAQRERKALILAEAHRALRQLGIRDTPWGGPIRLVVRAYWPRPRSRPAFVPREVWALGTACWRPAGNDVDNVAKLVMDALQPRGLRSARVYHDDAQVCDLDVQTMYCDKSGQARTQVEVVRLGWDDDAACCREGDE